MQINFYCCYIRYWIFIFFCKISIVNIQKGNKIILYWVKTGESDKFLYVGAIATIKNIYIIPHIGFDAYFVGCNFLVPFSTDNKKNVFYRYKLLRHANLEKLLSIL